MPSQATTPPSCPYGTHHVGLLQPVQEHEVNVGAAGGEDGHQLDAEDAAVTAVAVQAQHPLPAHRAGRATTSPARRRGEKSHLRGGGVLLFMCVCVYICACVYIILCVCVFDMHTYTRVGVCGCV